MQWIINFLTKGVPLGEAWASAWKMLRDWWVDPDNKAARWIAGVVLTAWSTLGAFTDWIGSLGPAGVAIFGLIMLPVSAFIAGTAIRTWRWAKSGNATPEPPLSVTDHRHVTDIIDSDKELRPGPLVESQIGIENRAKILDRRIDLAIRSIERIEALVFPKGMDGLSVGDWIVLKDATERNLSAFNHHCDAAKQAAEEAEKHFNLMMRSLPDNRSEVIAKNLANSVVQSVARAEEAYQLSGFDRLGLAQRARLHPGKLPIKDLEQVPKNLSSEYRLFMEALAYLEDHEDEMRNRLKSDLATVSLELSTMSLDAAKRLRNRT